MALLDGLLKQVQDAVTNHASDREGFDPSKLIGHITDIFNKHPAHTGQNVRPASEDPFGDPGASGAGQRAVKPASEDPYGDPADQKR